MNHLCDTAITALLYLGGIYFLIAIFSPRIRPRRIIRFNYGFLKRHGRRKLELSTYKGDKLDSITCLGGALLCSSVAFTIQFRYPLPLWIYVGALAILMIGLVTSSLGIGKS